MKLVTKFLFLSAICLLLSSCGDINQEMWLEKDGSGKVEYSVDLGDALPMLTMMIQGAAQEQLKDTPNGEETKKKMDEIMEKVSTGAIDTSFNMAQILPDNIKGELDNPEKFRKINLDIDVDAENGKALLNLGIDFSNFAEIDELYTGLLGAFAKGRPEFESFNINDVLKGNSFDGNNYFSKKEYKLRVLPQVDETGGGQPQDEQMEQMAGMMFGNSTFIRTIHFPYEVKSATGADVEYEGNTVIMKTDMMDMSKSTKMTELNVQFKKKFLGIF